MLLFSRKKRASRLEKSVTAYIQVTLVQERQRQEAKLQEESEIRYSVDDAGQNSNDVEKTYRPIQFQLRSQPDDLSPINHNEECLQRPKDSYDSYAIQRAMKRFTSTQPAENMLLTLEKSMNIGFVDKLLEHISRKKLRDSQVYRAAQMDRRLFSKIVSDRNYKPSKDSCIALCIALKLSLTDVNDMLSRAGYVLSHSSKRDVILEYFFREQYYSISDINDVLYRLNQKVLGRT